MNATYRKKLIEVALPLAAINEAAAREKSIRHGHPSTLHLWWARRPLAAARAVLFAQLVDDPSAWPELFRTEEAQEKERQRLFAIIEKMVPWEATNNEAIIDTARFEIARSWARSHPSEKASRILAGASPEVVNDYLATELPPVHDPFAGGGTIPLEAQRLGLRAIATDLNPVAVLINKALIEIPPKFAGMPPLNPESRQKAGLRTWKGAEGLAEDVRYYGAWMREEARKRIGNMYPDVVLEPPNANRGSSAGRVTKTATPIAWVWARTVRCPNPTCNSSAPLVRSFALATKKGKEAHVVPSVERSAAPPQIHFRIVNGASEIHEPTISRNGARCLSCGSPIPLEFVRSEGRAGRLGTRLLATVAVQANGRLYVAPDDAQLSAAQVSAPTDLLETELPNQALGFRVQAYGLLKHRDLFTSRQLVLLSTFCDLVHGVRSVALDASRQAFGAREEAAAYADAISTYLAFAVSRMANYSSCLCFWSSHPKDELVKQVFSRQALIMAPDYAETNPFADSSGGWNGVVDYVAKAIPSISRPALSTAHQHSATLPAQVRGAAVCCDPPYYDNIGYADLSDFFYVWLRRALRDTYREITSGVLTPKDDELIAEPGRFATREEAQQHFEDGLTLAFQNIRDEHADDTPAAVFYAFKQSESVADASDPEAEAVVSSGWERMLSALCASGFAVVGTWPVRTELGSGLRELGRNALASSIVLVCRKRPSNAASINRGEFRRELRGELQAALRTLKHGNIAPVDVAQASIGPGMAIFSRHAKVLEADGSAMTVRAALQLINEALDEYLSAQEGDADTATRFAVTWFDSNGWDAGNYGDAETLAKARNVSVAGIAEAGVIHSAAGKVRLLKRTELPTNWDPARDSRVTVWEATQHLIKRLEEQGEAAGAALLKKLGPLAEHTRDLAYRLYSTCERKGWAEDARAYNGLVIAWPELEKLAASAPVDSATGQLGLGIVRSDERPATEHLGRRRRGRS